MRRIGYLRHSFPLFLFALAGLGLQADAQQGPSVLFQTNQFNYSAIFRQNVCVRHESYSRGETLLEDALQGFELHALLVSSNFFELNKETEAIDEKNPGLVAVLLDELARRGKFTWRNSFATAKLPDGGDYNELLQWSAETYDVSVDWWAQSTIRMAAGLTFQEGWYDASIILVGKNTASDEFDPWSFLNPFDREVWIMIAVSIVFSGIVYFFLESVDRKSDKRQLQKSITENIFLAGMSFTSHFEFHPSTNPARLFTFSLSFWALLTGAAYTANLASSLVVKNTPGLKINSLEDVIRHNLKICVHNTTSAHQTITDAFDNANLVRKTHEQDIFLGVLDGDCDIAATTVSTWQFWERNATVNDGCGLDWIGRVYKFLPAGFATIHDSGTLCTSLINDVLNIHLRAMKEEGFVEDAWEKHLENTATIDCEDPQTNSGLVGDSTQLNLQNMGGIFIFHFGLSIIAIILTLAHRLLGLMDKRDERIKKMEDHRKLKNARALMAATDEVMRQSLGDLPAMSSTRSRISGEVKQTEALENGRLSFARTSMDTNDESVCSDGNVQLSENDNLREDAVFSPFAVMGENINKLAFRQQEQMACMKQMENQISTIMNILTERNDV